MSTYIKEGQEETHKRELDSIFLTLFFPFIGKNVSVSEHRDFLEVLNLINQGEEGTYELGEN